MLGELIEPVQMPIPKPVDPYNALGIRSHCKGTFGRSVDDPSKVEMDELFVVRAGDLIVNITFALGRVQSLLFLMSMTGILCRTGSQRTVSRRMWSIPIFCDTW